MKNLICSTALCALIGGIGATGALAATNVDILLRSPQPGATAAALRSLSRTGGAFQTGAAEQVEMVFASGATMVAGPGASGTVSNPSGRPNLALSQGVYRLRGGLSVQVSGCSIRLDGAHASVVVRGGAEIILRAGGRVTVTEGGRSTVIDRPGYGVRTACSGRGAGPVRRASADAIARANAIGGSASQYAAINVTRGGGNRDGGNGGGGGAGQRSEPVSATNSIPVFDGGGDGVGDSFILAALLAAPNVDENNSAQGGQGGNGGTTANQGQPSTGGNDPTGSGSTNNGNNGNTNNGGTTSGNGGNTNTGANGNGNGGNTNTGNNGNGNTGNTNTGNNGNTSNPGNAGVNPGGLTLLTPPVQSQPSTIQVSHQPLPTTAMLPSDQVGSIVGTGPSSSISATFTGASPVKFVINGVELRFFKFEAPPFTINGIIYHMSVVYQGVRYVVNDAGQLFAVQPAGTVVQLQPDNIGNIQASQGYTAGIALESNGAGTTFKEMKISDFAINIGSNSIAASFTLDNTALSFSGAVDANDPNAFLLDGTGAASGATIASAGVFNVAAINQSNGPVVNVPQYSHLDWGVIIGSVNVGGSQVDLQPTGWVSGTPTSAQDLTKFAGVAAYKGHAFGNAVDANGVRSVVGTYNNTWDFGTRTGTASLDFDGRSFVGTTDMTQTGFTGSVSAPNGFQGNLNGQFYGFNSSVNQPEALGGTFDLIGTNTSPYAATGVVAAERQ